MAIQIDQTIGLQHGSVAANGTLSASFGTAPLAGSTIWVLIEYSSSLTGDLANIKISDNQGGSSYTLDHSQTYDGATPDAKVCVFRRSNITTGATFTVTFTNTSIGASMTVAWGAVAAKNVPTTSSLDKTNTSGALTNVQSANTGSTGVLTQADEIAFAVWGTSSGTADTLTGPGGSWTTLFSEPNGNTDQEGMGVYQIVSATTALSASFTTTAAANNEAAIIATYKGLPAATSVYGWEEWDSPALRRNMRDSQFVLPR